MSADTLKKRIQEDMKAAMRAGEKDRLTTIRLIMAAIKQLEIDGRIELDDSGVIGVLDKMAKQRNESITQFNKANRTDLADKETAELAIIKGYLPQPLSDIEIEGLLKEAITAAGATTMKDMGKVMGILKPKLQGRADMAKVSAAIKAKLS